MTRRIALAILLTVWAILIAGGVSAYWTTRAVLLADLDESIVARASALPEIAAATDADQAPAAHPDDRYLIRTELGRTLARPDASRRGAAGPQVIHRAFIKLGDGERGRTLTMRATAAGPDGQGELVPVTLIYTGSAQRFDTVLGRLAMALGALGIISGAAAAGVAVAVSRAALRPLAATAEVIGSIDERKLDRRIDAAALPVELAGVAARLNEMLNRLERAFAQRRQFLADASHELRTPIAALVTTLEVALRRPRDQQQMRQVMESCLSDAHLLQKLAHGLLEHVRSGETAAGDALESIDAAALLHECAQVAEGLALPRQVRVIRDIPQDLRVRTQPRRLRSIVMNLLANAVEYNRPGGTVELRCGIEDSELRVSVRDNGDGITAEHITHLFEPFYRAEKVRSGEGGHLGLGLFLVQSHVTALGGKCDVQSVPGEGTIFVVKLPLGTDAPNAATALEATLHVGHGV